MEIQKIDNIENYVVLTYPQFETKIKDIEYRIFGVCYNGSGLEDIECINKQTEENIFHKLPEETKNKIVKILLDILADKKNLTY